MKTQTPINAEARTKLTKARIAMIMRQPFFGQLALRLQLIENDQLKPPTAAVDGVHLYYHPDWVLENDLDIVMSMVAHEVGHVVYQHIGRRNGREPQRWNFAGDYVINLVLKDCGFVVPNTWLCDPVFAGKSTDEVYNILPPMPQGTGGQGAFDGHMDSMPQGTDPIDHADDWQTAAIQAANAQAALGDVPSSLKRFIEEIVVPKADWRAVMSRFITEVSREDYSYMRVNRRFAALGIYLPGLYSESMGTMAAGIDTSGSISQEVLNAFGAHLSEIRDQVKPEKTYNIYCDARVNHVDEFDKYDSMTFELHGGGGTDFRPPFRYMEEHGIEPKCFVYLTDGYGSFPKQPPPYPVLWLMTTDVTPPWGEVVRIEV